MSFPGRVAVDCRHVQIVSCGDSAVDVVGAQRATTTRKLNASFARRLVNLAAEAVRV